MNSSVIQQTKPMSKPVKYLLLGLILMIGSVVRLLWLDKIPFGLHQDEAFSAYNAYALMQQGIDSRGYAFPVYYVVWGSGMSVLYSYLTMPFIAVLGLHVLAIRLPQALLGCLTLFIVYLLVEEITNERLALFTAFLVMISPIHIMLSRFGLDAYLAPAILVIGMYFLVRARNGHWLCFVLSMFFMGMTLYCYVLTWPFMPFFLAMAFLCLRKNYKGENGTYSRKYWIGLVLLFLLALPLLLFMLINWGILPEIKTSFFSIPKLPGLRSSEFSFRGLPQKIMAFFQLMLIQYDGRWWISSETYGAYYAVSIPFTVVGILLHGKEFCQAVRRKKVTMDFIMLLWLFCSFMVCILVDSINLYKMNVMHLPMIFYCAYGCYHIARYIHDKYLYVLIGVYAGLFAGFAVTYFSYRPVPELYGYPKAHMFENHYEETLDYAHSLTDGPIGVYDINYANMMFYSKILPEDFIETVTYTYTDPAWQSAASFGPYVWNPDLTDPDPDMAYVFPNAAAKFFRMYDYEILPVTDYYYLGLPPNTTLSH